MNKGIKLIRHADLPNALKPCVATIGNFDGVHLGHQAILQKVINKARQLSLVPTVITFEPSPLSVLRPKESFARIMKFSQKLAMLSAMGIEQVVCLRFNPAFAKLTPMQFIEQYLVKLIGLSHLFIGEGFRFGHQQAGSVQTLTQGAQTFGFDVQAIEHKQSSGAKISSSEIRHLLTQGELDQVAQLLGRSFSITSRVVKGSRRGTDFGFPTANLAKHPGCALIKGVFVTMITVDGIDYQGVANSGTRPTVDGLKHILEVHLLHFNGDLYGKKITVKFLHKLRNEQRFDNIEQLKQQITVDVQKTKTFFAQSLLKEIN